MRIPFFLAAQGLTSHDVAYDADAPQPCVRAGTPIPARFDHERGDLSPALAWDGVPESTAGLVSSIRSLPAGIFQPVAQTPIKALHPKI